MKRNNKIATLILTLVLVFVLSSNVLAATTDLENEVRASVEQALENPCFGYYNIAIAEIMKLEDGELKEELNNNLSQIANTVFTDNIKYYVDLLIELSQSGSARLYDRLESELRGSDLYSVDKEYLLGELTSWGKKLVYTDDYKVGVDSVVNAWNCLAKAQYNNDSSTVKAISDAQNVISKVNSSDNKAYLTEQLQQVKEKLVNKPTYVVGGTPSVIKDENGLTTTSTGRNLIFLEDYTKEINDWRIERYEKEFKNPKTNEIIQSCLNISMGKDVTDEIKTPWEIDYDGGRVKCQGQVDNIGTFSANDFNRILYDGKYIKNDPPHGAWLFRYYIVYQDPTDNSYEVHYICIGL